ncbi:MAG: Phosphate regulon transcriptional regulatory protein PhoB (SphR) [uncultured Thiotrichaceae bacterium]|uniref:Phosphate regulon transcriptional regulatory protein PhoB n=1 Tax=uncultured Thiotrichaceae bacterium TaxID=298394 RepID=A0A6S6U003_9GAMM|nr:MAG: Phosphate regulon transcriptional regulatory protein PhoB (SphR) [uncultured Thiotrichaceae bacterium]
MGKILVVEDERDIRSMLGFALSRAGFETIEAETSKQAWGQLNEVKPDLILMDWMLPDGSGIEMIRHLKSDRDMSSIPVIMLTARTQEEDRIRGLNVGAEDYVCKPFSPRELLARVNAVLRRNTLSHQSENRLELGQLVLDADCHTVTIEGSDVKLGATEFRLLQFLMEHPERVYSREMLLNKVWGRNKYVEERTVDVHVLRLRRALEPWGYNQAIQTVRSVGYRFVSDFVRG